MTGAWRALPVALMVIIALCLAPCVWAQWIPHGAPACTTAGWQGRVSIASDGAGGAVLAWSDSREGDFHVYAQRFDAAGNAWWKKNGVPVCTQYGKREYPAVAGDSDGGAFVAWRDQRSGESDVYVQRIGPLGDAVWTEDGLLVCGEAGEQSSIAVAVDGSGGAIIVWEDGRSGNNADIYAQRVSASGEVVWSEGGKQVCLALGDQSTPVILSTGSGGAIIAWTDSRNGQKDIYVQKLGADGSSEWAADGEAVCVSDWDQQYPRITSDESDGAIVVWEDARNADNDIYAQRFGEDGAPLWDEGGIPVCFAEGDQDYPELVSDTAGGAIVVWEDGRAGKNIYAQRLGSEGTRLWGDDGLALCDIEGYQGMPKKDMYRRLGRGDSHLGRLQGRSRLELRHLRAADDRRRCNCMG